MTERQRLLALLEVYDTAVEELYVFGDRGLVDLILRLERRRIEAAARLAELDGGAVCQAAMSEGTAADSPVAA